MQRKKPELKKRASKPRSDFRPVRNRDHGQLPSVIHEGILQASVGSKLLVSRQLWKKLELHECMLHKIDADESVLELFDEVLQQMYVVSLKEKLPEVFKILKHGVEATPPSVSSIKTAESQEQVKTSSFVVNLLETDDSLDAGKNQN